MSDLPADLVEPFRQKRFLFVLGQYSKLGGAERQAIVLANEMIHRVGCRVEFLAWGGEGRVTDELAALGIAAHRFPLHWRRGPLHRLNTLRRLGNFIRDTVKPDFLLPYIGFNCKIIGLIWKRTGARFTWWNQRDEGRQVHGSRVERRVIESVPSIVANSYVGKDFLKRLFDLPESRIRVINNGIPLPGHFERADWRSKLHLTENDLLLTMVANLTRYKDHETLLRAFSELRKSELGDRCHLALAGDRGETTSELKVLAFDLGLAQSVHFLGTVDDPDGLLAATDLAVHSSMKEGCPNAVLEAMAHGLCVCGTDIPGMRQAVGNADSAQLLAAGKDSRSFYRIMRALLEAPELRSQIGTRNRERIAANFSPSALLSEVLTEIRATAIT